MKATPVLEKDMTAIIEWFERRKRPLYALGRSYFDDAHDIEEVFYNTMIKVFDGILRLKENTNFDLWVISLFLHECRGVSSKKRVVVSDKTTLGTLKQMEEIYREPIALSYLYGLSQEEVVSVLQVPVQTVKSRLFMGVGSHVKGVAHDSCREYQENFIDYLSRVLNRAEKIQLEMHLHTCQSCQSELAAFQDMISTISKETIDIPSTFMEKIVNRVNHTQMVRRKVKKKRTIYSIVLASVLTLLIFTGYATNSYAYFYYSWLGWVRQEDEQLLNYLKSGLGEPLNMESVSNGVKVKIKTAIADDYQTLIYYEIEDMENNNQYVINMYDGVIIENEDKILDIQGIPMYSPIPPEQSEDNNISKGKFSIFPIAKESGDIKLKLTRLHKAVDAKEGQVPFDQNETIEGDWSFTIPVTKQTSIVHELDKEIDITGVPVHIEKLTIAPTTTVLQYSIRSIKPDEHIYSINIEKLTTKNKNVQVIPTGGMFNQSYITGFETLYFDNPKEINVHFGSINFFIQDDVTIDIDLSKGFPQTFEYIGNKISIDDITVGTPTKVVLVDEVPENREYETFSFEFLTAGNDIPLSMGIASRDGVLIDRNGKTYNINDYHHPFGEMEYPRFYQKEQVIELYNELPDKQVIPDKLRIQGYYTTKYIDEIVDISLQ
ncbi:DUF4179 domain-containing protein [Fredinandcohnia humi]